MINNFFEGKDNSDAILQRINEIESGRVGLYSVGLYGASLAYNSAMQTDGSRLLLAPRPGRKLLGAFSSETLESMDSEHIKTIYNMGF